MKYFYGINTWWVEIQYLWGKLFPPLSDCTTEKVLTILESTWYAYETHNLMKESLVFVTIYTLPELWFPTSHLFPCNHPKLEAHLSQCIMRGELISCFNSPSFVRVEISIQNYAVGMGNETKCNEIEVGNRINVRGGAVTSACGSGPPPHAT